MTSARLHDSGISGYKLANNLPKLIAANHALHRLLAPRHPPCALSSLITDNMKIQLLVAMQLSKNNRKGIQRNARPNTKDQNFRTQNSPQRPVFANMVEMSGIEPPTSYLQGRRSPI